MINKKSQQGITALGMVIILSLIAFFAYLAIRLVPIYIESFKVSSALESVVKEAATGGMTSKEIRTSLMRRMQIDDVDDVEADDILITQTGGRTAITIQYDAVAPMTSTIDVVIYFKFEGEV